MQQLTQSQIDILKMNKRRSKWSKKCFFMLCKHGLSRREKKQEGCYVKYHSQCFFEARLSCNDNHYIHQSLRS